MLLRIKKTLALAVCLGSLLAAGTADKPRKPWRGMPDPFTSYGARRSPPPAANRGEQASGLRVVWNSRGRAQSFGLLFAACLCLIVLEMKVLRRTSGRHERLATRLAGALRGGALEFVDEATRFEGPIWSYAADDDEPDEPETALTQANKSRYQLLAYDVGEQASKQDATVTISYMGACPDPDALVRDDLLLGVPREFIKTGHARDK